MVRIPKVKAPLERKNELLGEVKNGLMYSCVYNELITGLITCEIPKYDCSKLVPQFLKDYQIEDLNKSLVLDKVFNINKPGYGKTLETILWIKLILKKDFKALILCPKTVIETWHAQLNKYWPEWQSDGDWLITNYGQLYNEQRFQRVSEQYWDVIVLDESHKIKSFKSKITELLMKLKSEHRHCLTGTPIKNRPEDLAAQLKWLDPYSITNFTDFQFAFCDMQKDNWGWKPCGLTKRKEMISNLQNLLDMYCIGGEEHNIIEPPQLIKVRLQLDSSVKKLYKKVEGEYDKELKMRVIDTAGLLDQGIKVSNPIESATRRQQLCSNPQLFDPKLTNVKFDWIIDWLEGTDEKVVIFSKYAKTIEKLKECLDKKKIPVSAVLRQQSSEKRSATIEFWKRNSKCQVLLGTFGILSEGVDGLQEFCRYVIFVDREWTRADNEQAEKRIARTGQTKQVFLYVLQGIGTIDIKVEKTQYDKGADAAMLLDPVDDSEE